MAVKTHGDYMEPVFEVIDKNFPEGRIVETSDLRVIAALCVATVLDIQHQPSEQPQNDNTESVGE